MRVLFTGLPAGTNTVEVDITGNLISGGSFKATFMMTVKSNGAFLAASISPNPLNPRAKLTFQTTKPGAVQVHLFDAQGRLVKTIADETSLQAGYHDFTIDGRTSTGAKRVGRLLREDPVAVRRDGSEEHHDPQVVAVEDRQHGSGPRPYAAALLLRGVVGCAAWAFYLGGTGSGRST